MTAARRSKPAARRKPSLKLIRGGKSEKPAAKKSARAKAAPPKPAPKSVEERREQPQSQAKQHPFARFILQKRPELRSGEPTQRWYQQPSRKKAV